VIVKPKQSNLKRLSLERQKTAHSIAGGPETANNRRGVVYRRPCRVSCSQISTMNWFLSRKCLKSRIKKAQITKTYMQPLQLFASFRRDSNLMFCLFAFRHLLATETQIIFAKGVKYSLILFLK